MNKTDLLIIIGYLSGIAVGIGLAYSYLSVKFRNRLYELQDTLQENHEREKEELQKIREEVLAVQREDYKRLEERYGDLFVEYQRTGWNKVE